MRPSAGWAAAVRAVSANAATSATASLLVQRMKRLLVGGTVRGRRGGGCMSVNAGTAAGMEGCRWNLFCIRTITWCVPAWLTAAPSAMVLFSGLSLFVLRTISTVQQPWLVLRSHEHAHLSDRFVESRGFRGLSAFRSTSQCSHPSRLTVRLASPNRAVLDADARRASRIVSDYARAPSAARPRGCVARHLS